MSFSTYQIGYIIYLLGELMEVSLKKENVRINM